VAPSPADAGPVVASSLELIRALLLEGEIAAAPPTIMSISAIANLSRANRRERA
jgi:hypothetical protein